MYRAAGRLELEVVGIFLLGLLGTACTNTHAQPNVCVNCSDAKPVVIDAPFCGVNESSCSVLTQAGCIRGDKCTVVRDPAAPTTGCIRCASDGNVPIGSPCTFANPAAGLVDDCVGGAICTGGTCKQICDTNLGLPVCPASEACIVVEGLFVPAGSPTSPAGVCEPT